MTKTDTSKLVLLDVSVLIALAWPNHPFHQSAVMRMERQTGKWASCAITQLGFIRVCANPHANAAYVSPQAAAELMGEMARDPMHLYIDQLPAPATEWLAGALGPRKVTDLYLLALAQRQDAVFVTFDARLKDLTGVEVLT